MSTPVPTPEALTLSASLFHTSVDSWLPANFGVTRTEQQKASDWDSVLRSSAARSERLGIGHADLVDPEARARASSKRAALTVLGKSLKGKSDEANGVALVPGSAGGSGQRAYDRQEDDTESRTKALGSKKKKTSDPFATKKNKTPVVEHPLLNLSKKTLVAVGMAEPSPASSRAQSPAAGEGVSEGQGTPSKQSAQGQTGNKSTPSISKPDSKSPSASASTSAASTSKAPPPSPKTGQKRSRPTDADDAESTPAKTTSPSVTKTTTLPDEELSKTQLRREKRKRAKAAKKAKTLA